jgi:hypothetical protein
MTQMIENLIEVPIHQLMVMIMVTMTIRTNMIVRKSTMMTMQKRNTIFFCTCEKGLAN